MTKPNFFIIGAMKAGTSSLHSYLGSHPAVFMCTPKEPAYFQNEPPIDPTRPYKYDLGAYLALFARAGDRPIIGESTTDYTKLPKWPRVAERILAFNPDARFLYIMRDPIQRTISHYWWNVWKEGETRDMLTAIKADPFYHQVSDYAMQLTPYLELAGFSRVKTIVYEDFVDDPVNVLQGIFNWLGVDPSFVPPNLHEKENVTPAEIQQVKNRLIYKFRYSRLWNRIGRYTPGFVRKFGRMLVERRVSRTADISQEVLEYLRPIMREQLTKVTQLLGRPFPKWNCVSGYDELLHEDRIAQASLAGDDE
jgi:hypothetical protein